MVTAKPIRPRKTEKSLAALAAVVATFVFTPEVATLVINLITLLPLRG